MKNQKELFTITTKQTPNSKRSITFYDNFKYTNSIKKYIKDEFNTYISQQTKNIQKPTEDVDHVLGYGKFCEVDGISPISIDERLEIRTQYHIDKILEHLLELFLNDPILDDTVLMEQGRQYLSKYISSTQSDNSNSDNMNDNIDADELKDYRSREYAEYLPPPTKNINHGISITYPLGDNDITDLSIETQLSRWDEFNEKVSRLSTLEQEYVNRLLYTEDETEFEHTSITDHSSTILEDSNDDEDYYDLGGNTGIPPKTDTYTSIPIYSMYKCNGVEVDINESKDVVTSPLTLEEIGKHWNGVCSELEEHSKTEDNFINHGSHILTEDDVSFDHNAVTDFASALLEDDNEPILIDSMIDEYIKSNVEWYEHSKQRMVQINDKLMDLNIQKTLCEKQMQECIDKHNQYIERKASIILDDIPECTDKTEQEIVNFIQKLVDEEENNDRH